jgi:outer membrane protein
MKKKIALFLGLLLVASVSHAELKIGVVNIAAVLEKAPQAEKAQKRLEQKFLPREKQLKEVAQQIKTLEEKLTKDAAVMSESEKANLEKDLANKTRDAKRTQQELSEDFNASRNEELNKLQRHIVEAIREIAKDQNFDLLLAEGVIYANDKIDITAQVQQKLSKIPD